MTFEEFAGWLGELVADGELAEAEANDLYAQRAAFEEVRSRLAEEFDQRVVGFQRGRMRVADSVGELLATTGADGLVYFEAIGYDPFGGG